MCFFVSFSPASSLVKILFFFNMFSMCLYALYLTHESGLICEWGKFSSFKTKIQAFFLKILLQNFQTTLLKTDDNLKLSVLKIDKSPNVSKCHVTSLIIMNLTLFTWTNFQFIYGMLKWCNRLQKLWARDGHFNNWYWVRSEIWKLKFWRKIACF